MSLDLYRNYFAFGLLGSSEGELPNTVMACFDNCMPRLAKTLSVGNDNTQHLSLGVIALCFPVVDVQRAIEACGKASRRVRDLPAAVVAYYYIIGLSLFPGAAYESVLRWLLCHRLAQRDAVFGRPAFSLSWLVGKSARHRSASALAGKDWTQARTAEGA